MIYRERAAPSLVSERVMHNKTVPEELDKGI